MNLQESIRLQEEALEKKREHLTQLMNELGSRFHREARLNDPRAISVYASVLDLMRLGFQIGKRSRQLMKDLS